MTLKLLHLPCGCTPSVDVHNVGMCCIHVLDLDLGSARKASLVLRPCSLLSVWLQWCYFKPRSTPAAFLLITLTSCVSTLLSRCSTLNP